jgi:hypothetical protein
LEWIDREFGWKERSARNFMNVYRNVSPHLKTATVADLQIEFRAHYLIAAPSTPEPARDEIIRRGKNGERINYPGARAVVKQFQETGELPDATVNLAQVIEARRAAAEPNRGGPVPPKPTRQEREETGRRIAEMKENTTRVAGIMSIIQAIELIAKCGFTIKDIADTINGYDTPDKDWHGKVGEARAWLGKLEELI